MYLNSIQDCLIHGVGSSPRGSNRKSSGNSCSSLMEGGGLARCTFSNQPVSLQSWSIFSCKSALVTFLNTSKKKHQSPLCVTCWSMFLSVEWVHYWPLWLFGIRTQTTAVALSQTVKKPIRGCYLFSGLREQKVACHCLMAPFWRKDDTALESVLDSVTLSWASAEPGVLCYFTSLVW